ncbi:MAG: hypothetical protein ACE5GW_04795, partial [Planctomycetota bacterium]
MTRSTLKRSGLILLLILGACAFVPLVAQDVDIAASAERIADRYGQGSLADAWRGARAIEDLGDDAIPWAQNTLDGDRATLRLMAAKALLSMGEEQGVQKVLVAIAADEGVAAAERAAAIQLLSDFPGAKVEKLLRGILEGEGSYDPALRVAAGRSLFAVSHDWRTARNSLIPLLDVDDAAVRGDAALVLGEMGLVDGKVKSILRSLEKEPTSLGDGGHKLTIVSP